MKVLLLVETPEDDELHHLRIARALNLYVARAEGNNRNPFAAIDMIGLDAGPNVLECGRGVRVTEQRIDVLCSIKLRLWLWLNRWPRIQRVYSALTFHA